MGIEYELGYIMFQFFFNSTGQYRVCSIGYVKLGPKRKLNSIFVGNSKEKRPLGRPRRRWEDNIRRNLREIGVCDKNWLHIVQNIILWRTFVTAAINLRVP